MGPFYIRVVADFPEERSHADVAHGNLVKELAAEHDDGEDGNEDGSEFRIHGILLTEKGLHPGMTLD